MLLRTPALFLLALALLCLPGCGDDRRTGPGPGPMVDGGPTRPVTPPGGVGLSVTRAGWESGVVVVEVLLANAPDGTPAPLGYTSFQLQTDMGAIVAASALSSEGCPVGVSVAPGASLGCGLAFEVPTGHTPTQVLYAADTRMAMAPIVACSSGAPSGLCATGQACSAGACQVRCSASAPTGACPGVADRCVDGACLGPCSSSEPTGWCDDGTCSGGTCEAGCYRFSSESACIECLSSAYEICGGASASCANNEMCSFCPFEQTTCECASTAACAGCEDEVRPIAECVIAQCPVCEA